MTAPLTKAETAALAWLAARGGDAAFDRNGVALAHGECAPHTRRTWNTLAARGLVEFYKPAGSGRGRLRLTAATGERPGIAHG